MLPHKKAQHIHNRLGAGVGIMLVMISSHCHPILHFKSFHLRNYRAGDRIIHDIINAIVVVTKMLELKSRDICKEEGTWRMKHHHTSRFEVRGLIGAPRGIAQADRGSAGYSLPSRWSPNCSYQRNPPFSNHLHLTMHQSDSHPAIDMFTIIPIPSR